ncbi:MAG: hypothetical protein AB7V40_12085, partial [Methyloceanibacter sp.]
LELQGVSNMEGGRGLVALMVIGPVGALAGLVLGVWLALRYFAASAGARRVAAYSGSVVLAIALLGIGYIQYLSLSDDVLVRNALPAAAQFEIRFPEQARLPDKLQGVRIDLDTDKNSAEASFHAAPPDGARPVIAGSVDLYFRTGSRFLVLKMQGEPDRLFQLKLAANPPASPELGPWQPLDYVADQPGGQPRKAGAGDDYAIRYRVERHD